MRIKENGIGSNYRTLNNDPISHFHDPRVTVEMYPSAWGKFAASVICDELDFNSGVREFNTEQEAKLFAMNLVNRLVARLDSALVENVVQKILERYGR